MREGADVVTGGGIELLGPTVPARMRTDAGRRVADDVRELAPIAFRLGDGRVCRFVPDGERIAIDAGDAAGTVVELAVEAWEDFVRETATAPGLLYGERLAFSQGSYGDLERWEPALRYLFSGRPIFDPGDVQLAARDGRPLDVRQSFGAGDDDATLRHFLREAGYLHVRGAFSRDEVAVLRDVIDTYAAAARPGDGRSWWATRANGERVLCRLVYLGLAAPAIARMSDHPQLRRFLSLVDEPLHPVLDRSDGHTCVLKPAGAVEGLADLPWHRDCGLGGHPFTCPALNIGIQLDAATAESGQLHFVPGSRRGSCHRSDIDRAMTVAIDTEPGDCTVHFGDTLHAAPPPTGTGPGRRTLYVGCLPVRAYDVIPSGKSYNDVILRRVGS